MQYMHAYIYKCLCIQMYIGWCHTLSTFCLNSPVKLPAG